MNDVKLHYNPNQPAPPMAHAYSQGTEVHLPHEQKKHLLHEVWHAVQQKQERVKHTIQMKI